MKKTFSPTYKKLSKLFIAAVTAASLSLTGGGAAAPLLSAIGAGPVVARAANDFSYQEASWDPGTNKVTYTEKTANNVTEIVTSSAETVTWNAGWYVVSQDATIDNRITVNGDVNLILADGKTLTASKGITVLGNNSLTIYAQDEETGKLIAKYSDDNGPSTAAIGRKGDYVSSGNITIHGGQIDANVNANFGAYATISGIGGGSCTTTIYGGTITAYGYQGGGISVEPSATVNIHGGTVTAIDNSSGAGIGGGRSQGCGTIRITGGTVTAKSIAGAGIGTGYQGKGGTISITGGNITAGGLQGAAIGSGPGLTSELYPSYVDGITISGGTVTAQAINESGTPTGIGVIGNDKGKSDPVTVQITGDTSLSGSVKNMEVTAGETLTVLSGSELKVTGTLTNNGTVTNSGTMNVESSATLTNNGTVTNSGTMTVASGGTVEVAENATLTVSSAGALTNSGSMTVAENATLTVSSSGKMTNNGTVTVATNGTATVESGGTFVGTNPAGEGSISGFLPTLTVKANNKTITYGDAPNSVADGVTVSGNFADGETEANYTHSGTLSYSYNYAQYGNVGAYNITPAGLTSTKYNISYATGTLTVEQKEVGLSWDDSTVLTFNGSPQAPTATATELVNGDEIAVTVSTRTNAGTGYTATATGLTGTKAGNYKLPTTGLTQTFSIAKAAAQTLADVTKSVAVGATSFTASVANVMPTNAGTLSYAKGGTETKTGTVTVSSWEVNASTGAVTATISGGASGDSFTLPVTITSTNYEDSTVSVVATLTNKQPQTISFANGSLAKKVGDADFTVTVTHSVGDGAVTYSVTSGTDVATVEASTGKVHILKTGSATITATAAETSTYAKATTSYTLTVNAAPAPAPSGGDTPSYEPSTDPTPAPTPAPEPTPAPTPEPAPSADTPGTSTETTTDPETGDVITTTTVSTVEGTQTRVVTTEVRTDADGNPVGTVITETVTDAETGVETSSMVVMDAAGVVTGITLTETDADKMTVSANLEPESAGSTRLALTQLSSSSNGLVGIPDRFIAADGTVYSVTGIAGKAMVGLTLSGLDIPDSITHFGRGAFKNAHVDKYVFHVLKAGKITMDKNAFQNQASGTKMVIHARNQKQFDKMQHMIEKAGGLGLKYKWRS